MRQEDIDAMMVKCGRHCCICRRHDPLHLQVHHIRPVSEGGKDELDNLIVTCITCHSDAHSVPGLGRRFTEEELRGHRDAVFKLVHEGKLLVPSDNPSDFEHLVNDVVLAVSSLHQAEKIRLDISPNAVEYLMKIVRGNGALLNTWSTVTFSDATIERARERARIKESFDELVRLGLIEWVSGQLFAVTHRGFLFADEVIAAAQVRNIDETQEPAGR